MVFYSFIVLRKDRWTNLLSLLLVEMLFTCWRLCIYANVNTENKMWSNKHWGIKNCSLSDQKVHLCRQTRDSTQRSAESGPEQPRALGWRWLGGGSSPVKAIISNISAVTGPTFPSRTHSSYTRASWHHETISLSKGDFSWRRRAMRRPRAQPRYAVRD